MQRAKLIGAAKGFAAVLGVAYLLYVSTQLALGIAGMQIILASSSQTPSECHGITLPASTTILSHKISPSPVILDGGATTRLQMPQADLHTFLSQLQINSTHPVTRGPNALPPSWAQYYYCCDSPTGDALMITVGDTTLPTVELQIYTDWN